MCDVLCILFAFPAKQGRVAPYQYDQFLQAMLFQRDRTMPLTYKNGAAAAHGTIPLYIGECEW